METCISMMKDIAICQLFENQVEKAPETIALIEEISKKSKCTLTFDGLLSGEEFIRFLQSCDIGLSTQVPDAEFNETSFPSKILSYLANGLCVVSVRMKALEASEISHLLHYYDENAPDVIAGVIKSIDFSKNIDARTKLQSLDKKFIQDIAELTK